mgnify:CR=1 FL=1
MDAPDNVTEPSSFQTAFTQPLQEEKLAPCQGNCPSGLNVRGWIASISQHARLGLSLTEAYQQAWQEIADRNPLLAITGRICPHPCQDQCNRNDKDGAVPINAMERFLGDWALAHDLPLVRLGSEEYPETIGVVGSGPAGLSFSYQMARRGYAVTIYEQFAKPGGMLRYGIPAYRLPEVILDGEIQRILDLGVQLKLDTVIGRDIEVGQLQSRHDVLFVGIGAQRALQLDIAGEEGPGVWSGTGYLNAINCGENVAIGSKVLVIGGGNTAIDAARAARRQGAAVTVLYRRTRLEMPAIDREIEDALQEDVQIEYLVNPVEIKRVDGAIESVLVQRMELGKVDDSGRRRPMPIPNSEYELSVDGLIVAVAQEPAWEDLGELAAQSSATRSSATRSTATRTSWLQADNAGRVADALWTGGDVLGLGIATQAISQGRAAAEKLHAQLRNLKLEDVKAQEPITTELVKTDLFSEKAAGALPRRPLQEWLTKPDVEIDQTLSEEQFLAEATRCFSCGLCSGCELCWMYCNAVAFTRVDQPKPGSYFELSLDVCEGCGKCLHGCPSGFLS